MIQDLGTSPDQPGTAGAVDLGSLHASALSSEVVAWGSDEDLSYQMKLSSGLLQLAVCDQGRNSGRYSDGNTDTLP